MAALGMAIKWIKSSNGSSSRARGGHAIRIVRISAKSAERYAVTPDLDLGEPERASPPLTSVTFKVHNAWLARQ
jgi:hypothetical protein